MADRLQARGPSAALTGADAVLLHGLNFVSAAILYDERLDVVMSEMRLALPLAAPRPSTVQLRAAAQSVCDAFRQRHLRVGALDWARARMQADAAVQDLNWAAFCGVAGAR